MSNGFGEGLIGLLGGSCCCFLFLIIVAFVIYKVLSKKKTPLEVEATIVPPGAAPRSPSGSSVNTVGRFAQYGNLISSVAEDGFYLSNQFLTPGSVVHYRYRQGGNWFTRSVPYQPGPKGHFVYVGSNPSDIEVVDAIAGGPSPVIDDPARTMITSGIPPAKPVQVERDDSPLTPPATLSSGYPSAY